MCSTFSLLYTIAPARPQHCAVGQTALACQQAGAAANHGGRAGLFRPNDSFESAVLQAGGAARGRKHSSRQCSRQEKGISMTAAAGAGLNDTQLIAIACESQFPSESLAGRTSSMKTDQATSARPLRLACAELCSFTVRTSILFVHLRTHVRIRASSWLVSEARGASSIGGGTGRNSEVRYVGYTPT